MKKSALGIKGVNEEELCSECFKVVGSRNRYRLVLFLGRQKEGVRVKDMVQYMDLKQPTVTHHLNVLKSVDAVFYKDSGRERLYTLNRDAHCFLECSIPF